MTVGFVCVICFETHPSADNQVPEREREFIDADQGVCPTCWEDADADEPADLMGGVSDAV